MGFGRDAARKHLLAGHPIYLGDQADYPGQVMRLYPDGRREIVQLDTKSPDATIFIVVTKLEPLPADQHWWRK